MTTDTQPLHVGEVLGDCSTVIAWADFTDDLLVVLTILPPNRRQVWLNANYETFLLNPETGRRDDERTHVNIVQATDRYKEMSQ